MQVYSQKSTKTTLPRSMSAVRGVEFTQRSTSKAGMALVALAASASPDRPSPRRALPNLGPMTLWAAAVVIATVARRRRRLVFILVALLSDATVFSVVDRLDRRNQFWRRHDRPGIVRRIQLEGGFHFFPGVAADGILDQRDFVP